MWKEAMWLGLPKCELEKWNILEGDLTGRFAYYRCETELPKGCELEIHITANSRYRLWVNGQAVLSGPCKGDKHRHFYETVNLTEYLTAGKNILAVQVLYCNPDTAVVQGDERASIFGVVTPGGGHRLAVAGSILNRKKEIIGTVTTGKAEWKVCLDGTFYLKSNEITVYLGAICEEIDFRKIPENWKLPGYDAGEWKEPETKETVNIDIFSETVGLVQRFPIKKRSIPLMLEEADGFIEEMETSQIHKTGILENETVIVPAGEVKEILLDAGCIKNGYPVYNFRGGKGSKVFFTYFEKFVSDTEIIKRTDAENGKIVGLTDMIMLSGKNICYEPFWYRTFRFLRIRIETAAEEVEIGKPVFQKTGYPLKAESWVKSSSKWVEEVWKMCVRTLENCMMETYMDCPYYEQLQFSMDTRLQMMFNYAVSTDMDLARKALEDYHYSMTPEGLIPGKYPSAYCQIISTFSLHYVYMLKEYYQQTGDIRTVKKYLPDMDIILGYYDRKINEDGLVGRLGYWEFVDWQKEWGQNAGIPAALAKGPSTIINLMYGYALQCAADINEAAGRTGMAEEYLSRQGNIVSTIQKLCWDKEKGMYQEGPAFAQFTQHAQAWAVLNGMADQENAQQILKNTMEDDKVIKCSFSTAYEWFRAMEQAGLYADTKESMERWSGLLEQGCTTCPEEPTEGRSECHAWSALPIYEMICCIAGIKAGEPGWKTVRIQPNLSYLPDLQGEAVTPKGKIQFSYRKDAESDYYKITMPDGLNGHFVHADGSKQALHGGKTHEFMKNKDEDDYEKI